MGPVPCAEPGWWSSLSGGWCSIRCHSLRRGLPRPSDQCCHLSGQGEPPRRYLEMAHYFTLMAACLSPASATTPVCPWLQSHIPLISPGVTSHLQTVPQNLCSQGLPAAQCSPPYPPTPSSQARLSLLSCAPLQERKVPSCSPQALARVSWRMPRFETGLVPHCAGALPWRQPVSIVQVPQTWLHVLLLQLTQHVALGKPFCHFLLSVSLPICLV